MKKQHAALLLSNIFLGANYAFYVSLLAASLTADSLYFMRTMAVFIGLFPVMFLIGQWRIDWRDLWKMGVSALLLVVGRMYLMLRGMVYTSPIDASIITTLIPVFIMIFSYFIIKERLTASRKVGIFIGLAGAVTLIISNSGGSMAGGQTLGNLLILASVICSSFDTLFVKGLYKKYHPITILGWTYALGMLFVVPTFWGDFVQTDFATLSSKVWCELGYLLILGTVVGTFLVYYGLQGVSATTSGIYKYVQPIVATAIALYWGQDHLTVFTIISALLIFTGVYFMIRPTPNHSPSSASKS